MWAAGNGLPCAAVLNQRSASRVSDEGGSLGGKMNHAQDRVVLFNKGDVDGELAIAIDEFFGAIQWIDKPKWLFIYRRNVASGSRVFADHWECPGNFRIDGRSDHVLGCLVGGC